MAKRICESALRSLGKLGSRSANGSSISKLRSTSELYGPSYVSFVLSVHAKRTRNKSPLLPRPLFPFRPNFCLPAPSRSVYTLDRSERKKEREKRNEVGAKKEPRGVDTMPPFYGKKQSPSAFESFPLGKISPSYSGDQINVTPLPREACRASAFPRRLGLNVFSPLPYSWELAVKIAPQSLVFAYITKSEATFEILTTIGKFHMYARIGMNNLQS